MAAYRFPYLLAGNSVVFKQHSNYYEHFYGDLEPGVHYIPIRADLGDLVEKINWARQNDDLVRQIGINGRQYAIDNLLPKDIFCYHALLLQVGLLSVANALIVYSCSDASRLTVDAKEKRIPIFRI